MRLTRFRPLLCSLLLLAPALVWGQVTVKFELLMGPDGQPAGYKFSESLATLKPGDSIGLAVGMNFESITVKSIERTGDRLVIDLEKELTLDTGNKKRLEFQLVDGFWIETDVLRKLNPSAAPAESEPGSLPPWVFWAGGAAVLVVIAVVVGFWLGRRR